MIVSNVFADPVISSYREIMADQTGFLIDRGKSLGIKSPLSSYSTVSRLVYATRPLAEVIITFFYMVLLKFRCAFW